MVVGITRAQELPVMAVKVALSVGLRMEKLKQILVGFSFILAAPGLVGAGIAGLNFGRMVFAIACFTGAVALFLVTIYLKNKYKIKLPL